jgi:hypothetical protein
MIYWKSKLITTSKVKRYIGIIIFVSLFVGIVAAIAILTARGITFTGSDIQESGILEIKSDPDNAKIYINDKEEGSTPDNVELVTGTYKIKLEKDGYVSWEKEVEIEPSIVTNLEPSLFSQELNLEQITYTSIDKAYFSNDVSQTVYTIIEKDKKELWLQDLEKSIFELSSTKPSKIAELDKVDEKCLNSGDYEIQISHNNQNLLLECSLASYKIFYVLENYSQNSTFRNINEEIGFNPEKIEFDFDDTSLIVDETEFLARYSLDDKKLILLIRKNSDFQPKYCQLTDNLLFINESYDGTQKQIFAIDSSDSQRILSIPEEINVNEINNLSCSLDGEKTFLLTGDKSTYILILEQNTAKLISSIKKTNINVISWAKEGEGFLFEKDNKLFSALLTNYPDNTTKVEYYKVNNNLEDRPIKAVWAKNSIHLVVHEIDDKKVYVQDVNGENRRLLFEGEISYNDSFCLSSNETFLALLLKDDDKNSNLYSLQLKI